MEDENNFLVGVGLRTPHFAYLEKKPKTVVDFFEAITENFFDTEGYPIYILEQVRKEYPISLHGVSMSIGSYDGLNLEYLKKLKDLINRIEPFVISDHLCFVKYKKHYLNELLPIPYTKEALKKVSENIMFVQEYLKRPIALENISKYIDYTFNEFDESSFFKELVRITDCKILLDINNLYVNSVNFQLNPLESFLGFPLNAIVEFHIAGYSDKKKFLFDTHSENIHKEVWNFYKEIIKVLPEVPLLIERDENIPPFEQLEKEVLFARKLREKIIKNKSTKQKKEIQNINKKYFISNSGDPKIKISLKHIEGFFHKIYQLDSDQKLLKQFYPAFFSAGTLTKKEVLELYLDGYFIRRIEAIEQNFPATISFLKIRNQNKLRKFYKYYLSNVYSKSYNLNQYGLKIRSFLPKLKEFQFKEQDILIATHLAKLDFEYNQVFHSKEENLYSLEIISDDSIFSLVENVRFFYLPYTLLELWLYLKRDPEGQEENIVSLIKNIKKEKEYIVLSKNQYKIFVSKLTEWQYFVLKKIQKGFQLKLILKDIQSQNKIGQEEMLVYLKFLIKNQWIYRTLESQKNQTISMES